MSMLFSTLVVFVMLKSCGKVTTYETEYLTYPRCYSDHELMNQAVDFVMLQVKQRFPDAVDLPSMSSQHFLNMIKIELTSGLLSGISTMHRVGDLDLTVTDDQMNVILHISFEKLTVTYGSYKTTVLGIKSTGSLHASIVNSVFKLEATMANQSMCLLGIHKIELVELGNMNVNLQSLCEICDKLVNWASTHVLNAMKKNVQSLIQGKIDSALSDILKPIENSLVCERYK